MTDAASHRLPHLPRAAAGLGAAFARPKAIAAACVVTLTAAGWLCFGLQAGDSGPLAAICRSAYAAGELSAGGFALIAVMWSAMVLAMMLPSAAPMILTYAEIADTAARKSAPVVSPVTLTAGYTVVWLGFAVIAATAQVALTRAALLDDRMVSASALLSGAILIGAGLYQFSALKHACLTQCQRPFPFLFTHWATTPRGVFRLGLTQGVFCLGCCWAMMLVMFALGAMNVIWMAVLGIVMTVEKIGTTRRLSHAIGVALIAGGLAFIVGAAMAGWPARGI